MKHKSKRVAMAAAELEPAVGKVWSPKPSGTLLKMLVKARRIVLVVKERPDDLLLDRFFLFTSLDLEQMSRQDVLDYYRERGTAEGHMG